MALYSDINPNYGRSKLPELVTDLDAVNASIENIILTNPGERVMRPEFGSYVARYVHEPINDFTAGNLRAVIISAIERWEPRVRMIDSFSSVTPYPDRNMYEVVLAYEIVGLNIEGTFQKALTLLEV